MSYAELIQELFRRSGMGVNEWADAISISRAHVSHIINGKHRGSHKILEAALRHAGCAISDLRLPEPDPQTNDEKDVVRWFRQLTGDRRAAALGMLKSLAWAEKQKRTRSRE